MFSVREIAAATSGRVVGSEDAVVSGVSTDSRSVKAGELFVALKGERFDGHDYIATASQRGVAVHLVESGWLAANPPAAGQTMIGVQDTLRGLGDLAAYHRKRFGIKVAGVTGSNGKTTTKEMLAAILEKTGEGLKTEGNLNNLIGLPQMLLRLTEKHRWAVLEMGMSEFGEIDRLAEIAAPRVGIITNAFPAHLESLKSVEGVARAKGELFLRIPAGGFAVYNADDPLISRLPVPDGVKRISYGLKSGDVTATAIRRQGKSGQQFTLKHAGESGNVSLKALGEHNVYNALAAAAAAGVLGVDLKTICEGLAGFVPYAKRFNIEELGEFTLIDDSYNANPASMRAALITLREIKEECRGIAVLGDMLELGAGTEDAHRELGQLAAGCVDRLYLMGELSRQVADGAIKGGMSAASIMVASDHAEIVSDLVDSLQSGDCILVKGSRGMKMEKVAEGLREVYAGKGKGGVTP